MFLVSKIYMQREILELKSTKLIKFYRYIFFHKKYDVQVSLSFSEILI